MGQMNLGGSSQLQSDEDEQQKAAKLVTETFLNKDETIKINKILDIRNPILKTQF